jgi:hypothetical protein
MPVIRPNFGRFKKYNHSSSFNHSEGFFGKSTKRRPDFIPKFHERDEINRTYDSSKRFGSTKKYIIRGKGVRVDWNVLSWDIKPIHPYHGGFN